MEEEDHLKDGLEGLKVDTSPDLASTTTMKNESDSAASTPRDSKGSRSGSLSPVDRKTSSDSAPTPNGIQPSKISRKAWQKLPPRPTALLTDLPDVTAEACEHFQVIPDCLYGSKALGSTDHDSLDCDCSEEWRRYTLSTLCNSKLVGY